MKKLLIILSMFIFTTDSVASGISGGTTAPCDNATLNKYTGTANVEINWEPNTINLNWYDGDTKLTVANNSQTCVYDGTLTVPTQPTKPGYTFNGWKVIRVPGGFTELQYIESTGYQYINTGVRLTSDNVVYEWNAKDNDTDGNTSLFGTQTDVSVPPNSGILHGENNQRNAYLGNTFYQPIAYNSSDGAFHQWSWVINSDHTTYLIKDGTKLSTVPWTGELNRVNPIALFGNNITSMVTQLSSIALKYFKITDNGNLVFNGIPAKRNSDNVLGLYDTVSGQFFTNAGTGTFTAGPVVQ